MTAMTPQHPRWEEFCVRLEGPEGCNFVTLDPATDIGTLRVRERLTLAVHGHTAWWCSGATENRYILASAVLWAMGFTREDIQASFAYFAAHGGHCDCEILFNVDVDHETVADHG